ncbi:MAG: hypothetical protein R3F59_15815 [Myxococcota bacterium]
MHRNRLLLAVLLALVATTSACWVTTREIRDKILELEPADSADTGAR